MPTHCPFDNVKVPRHYTTKIMLHHHNCLHDTSDAKKYIITLHIPVCLNGIVAFGTK